MFRDLGNFLEKKQKFLCFVFSSTGGECSGWEGCTYGMGTLHSWSTCSQWMVSLILTLCWPTSHLSVLSPSYSLCCPLRLSLAFSKTCGCSAATNRHGNTFCLLLKCKETVFFVYSSGTFRSESMACESRRDRTITRTLQPEQQMQEETKHEKEHRQQQWQQNAWPSRKAGPGQQL